MSSPRLHEREYFSSLVNYQGLTVADAHAARAELAGRGVAVSEVTEFPWGSFAFFEDPDGNRWSLQQLPVRE